MGFYHRYGPYGKHFIADESDFVESGEFQVATTDLETIDQADGRP
jgi:hypothetical protein